MRGSYTNVFEALTSFLRLLRISAGFSRLEAKQGEC
jgi:hypothetical protein